MSTTATPAAPPSGSPRPHYASAREGFYPLLIGAFVAVLLISNIAATKIIGFGPEWAPLGIPVLPIVTDGGAFLFPLAYVLGDVLSEVYGPRKARRAILAGFAALALAVLVFWLVQISPPGPGYENQAAFESVVGFVWRLALAGLAGFLVGQTLNTYVLVRLKRRFGERGVWGRLVASTGVGEFADTLVFCTVAFAGVIPGNDFWNYVVVGFVYKVAVEVLVSPLTLVAIRAIKRREPSYGFDDALAASGLAAR